MPAARLMARRLELTEAEITRRAAEVFGAEHRYRRDFLPQYDSYYIDHAEAALPVWRIAIDTREHHSYYVSPERGRGRLIADNERIDAWMFSSCTACSSRSSSQGPGCGR